MDFLPSEDQLAFVRATAEFLTKQLPGNLTTLVDQPLPRGFLAACAEQGWFGLGVDAEAGGAGGSVVEETLLFRELGRSLAPGPFLATVLAGRVALAAGDQALAESIFAGERVVALAESVADREPDTVRIFDPASAELVLHLGLERAELWAMPSDLTAVRALDELTSIVRARLTGEPLLAEPGEPIRQLGWILLAGQLTGIAEATRDTAVAYLKTREQFGRPIGAFQALKHRAADMAVKAEAAFALSSYAALALVEDDPHQRLYAMSARVIAGQSALQNARANIQLHGAMGTTFEHDAHFYLKRTHVLGHQLGGGTTPLRGLLSEPSPLLVIAS